MATTATLRLTRSAYTLAEADKLQNMITLQNNIRYNIHDVDHYISVIFQTNLILNLFSIQTQIHIQ